MDRFFQTAPIDLASARAYYLMEGEARAAACSDQSCSGCHKTGEELHQLPVEADDNGWYCGDCYAHNSMILEAEALCDVLYELVCQARSVAEVSELMAEHECADCRPARKPMGSVKAGDPMTKGKVA